MWYHIFDEVIDEYIIEKTIWNYNISLTEIESYLLTFGVVLYGVLDSALHFILPKDLLTIFISGFVIN